jgi:hypothetical protein
MEEFISSPELISTTELCRLDLQSVYLKLSVTDTEFFDAKNDNLVVVGFIEECFSREILQKPTEEIQNNIEFININFANLIKFCVSKNFKKFGIIFINFCEYFDLDLRKTYLIMHVKLQSLIEHNTKQIIGKNNFQKIKVKNSNGIVITSLFDLVKKL